MAFSRRQTIALAGAAFLASPAQAQDDLIAQFTGGAPVVARDLVLTAPERAENGQSVPITLSCPGAREVQVIAPANPFALVCTLHLPEQGAPTRIATRIRLAQSQQIVALARMADGTWREARAEIIVETAGCVG